MELQNTIMLIITLATLLTGGSVAGAIVAIMQARTAKRSAEAAIRSAQSAAHKDDVEALAVIMDKLTEENERFLKRMQCMAEKLEKAEKEIAELRHENGELRKRINELERENTRLRKDGLL